MDAKTFMPLMSDLESLGRAFMVLGEYPAIRHLLVVCPNKMERPTIEQWQLLFHSSGVKLYEFEDPDEWVRFDPFPDLSAYSRFCGKARGLFLEEFDELADQGAFLLGELRRAAPECCSAIPYHATWSPPGKYGWLVAIYSEQTLGTTFSDDYKRIANAVDKTEGAFANATLMECNNLAWFSGKAIRRWLRALEPDVARLRKDLGLSVKDEAEVEVEDVRIGVGEKNFVLRVKPRRQPLVIDPLYTKMFALFVHKVALDSSAEFVEWAELSRTIPGDVLERAKSGTDKASDKLRKRLLQLNEKLKRLGRTPNGRRFLDTREGRGIGARLNTSVRWSLEPELQDVLSRKRRSVGGRPTDPHTMQIRTADPTTLPPEDSDLAD